MKTTPTRLPPFELAGGSVAGADHVRTGRANQDAFTWRRGERALVAAVCDGCGSGRHSEVGAKLGARLLTDAAARLLDAGAPAGEASTWSRVRRDLLAQLRLLANAMGGSLTDTVADYFLFTVVGVAVTPAQTVIVAAGDGLFAVNGVARQLGPFPGNQPPYLSYDLVGDEPGPPLAIEARLPTAEVGSVVIGTDGAVDLPAGELSVHALCTDPRLFRNRDAVRRRLALLAAERVTADWQDRRLVRARGRLPDDTTVIALRRGAA